MTSDTPECLETELQDRVLTIRLARPDRLNALNNTLIRELCAVIDRVDADDEIRVAVVTGRVGPFARGRISAKAGAASKATARTPRRTATRVA